MSQAKKEHPKVKHTGDELCRKAKIPDCTAMDGKYTSLAICTSAVSGREGQKSLQLQPSMCKGKEILSLRGQTLKIIVME